MANFGSATSLLTFCVGAVTGIVAQSYTAATSGEQVTISNECGETSGVHTKNAVVDHTWSGFVTGPSASGVALVKVNNSIVAPSGAWGNNMPTSGSSFICTQANYSETAGEAANFDFTCRLYAGV